MKAELKFALFLFLVVFLLASALIIFPWQKLLAIKGSEGHSTGGHHPLTIPLGGLELGLIFFSGLMGGVHCLGMCGGIVAAYSFRLSQEGKKGYGIINHLLFNGGRLFTYVILGVVIGGMGSLAGRIPWFHSFQGLIPVFLGILMLLMALSFAGILPDGLNIFRVQPSESGSGGGMVGRWVGRVLAYNSSFSLFLLGFLVGFLPCGLVYAVAVKAAATGTWQGGAATMALFGLGTWPALWTLGAASWKLSFLATPQHRLWAFRLAAVSIGLLGVLTLMRGVFSWV